MAVQSQTSTQYPTLCGWWMVTYLTPAAQAWPPLGFLEVEATAFVAESWKNLPVEQDHTLTVPPSCACLPPGLETPLFAGLLTWGKGKLAEAPKTYAFKYRSSIPSAKKLPRSIV